MQTVPDRDGMSRHNEDKVDFFTSFGICYAFLLSDVCVCVYFPAVFITFGFLITLISKILYLRLIFIVIIYALEILWVANKLGITSVQSEKEDKQKIVPMKKMKTDWLPNIPMENRPRTITLLLIGACFLVKAATTLARDFVMFGASQREAFGLWL